MEMNIRTLTFMSKLAKLMDEFDNIGIWDDPNSDCGEINIVDKTTQNVIYKGSDLNAYLRKFSDSLVGYIVFNSEKIYVKYSFENNETIKCVSISDGNIFYIPYKNLLKE